jgi:plastocyanin
MKNRALIWKYENDNDPYGSENEVLKMKRIQIMLGCILLLSAGPAAGVDVSGEIQLSSKKTASQAVVVLEGAQKAKPMPKAMIDQRDKTFAPHVLVVTVGTTVEFPNNDVVFHNVFAYYDAKRFDLGMYPRGKSKQVTFEKPGIVAILCSVHSEMSAYVYVTDSPFYAITDKQGKFRINDVPPGEYTLRVWHESGAVYTQKISVKAGTSPELNIRLVRPSQKSVPNLNVTN